jgi:gamma-glutamyl-gamma-aminobutyrate hydrolase
MYKPVIGVVMCRNRLKGHQTQTLQEKYLNAIVNAGGLPIALPHALAEPELLNALLPKLDGIYLPGSPSNVQPHLYGENGDEPDADPGRDLLSMALINAALERRIPIFAICRGLQELVVATGGTLYRRLFEQPELLEHREDPELPVEQQYAPSHQVQVQEGGLLSQLIPGCNTFWVNSLHGQEQNIKPRCAWRRVRRMGWWKRSALTTTLSRWAYSGILNGTVANTPCRVCCLKVLSPPVRAHAEKRRL